MREKAKVRNEKEQQLQEATKYCIEKKCRGYQVVSTGLFPLIKDPRTTTGILKIRKKQETFDSRRKKLLQNLDKNGGDIPTELSLKQK